MNINLNIEQIVLEGVDLPRSQRSRLQEAPSAELSRLMSEHGIPPHLRGGGEIPNLHVNVKEIKGLKPEQMGVQIAQSIYGGMVS